MPRSIFDSKVERAVYRRLNSHWKNYVEVYAQVPIRKVVGYETLRNMGLSKTELDYLMRTEFDFVVCERDTGEPCLAIEFDGIGHGFSRDGIYHLGAKARCAPGRKWKLDTKLRACELSGTPLVVVSFPETCLLPESGRVITILDGIIAEVLASRGRCQLVASHYSELTEASEEDPTGEQAESLLCALEVQADLQHNPLRRRTAEIFRQLPVRPGAGGEFLRDREGYVGMRKFILGGFELRDGKTRSKVLLSAFVYVRDLNCMGCNGVSLADCLAEYCLAVKALCKVRSNLAKWQALGEKINWSDWEGPYPTVWI